MQWLAALCVRRPVFAWVLVLSLTVVGLFAFGRLGVDRFPNVDIPTISVTTRLPGAAPEQIETEVTDKIEEAVNTISGIDTLTSTSSEGISQVVVVVQAREERRHRRAGSARPRQPRPAAAAAHGAAADGGEARLHGGAGDHRGGDRRQAGPRHHRVRRQGAAPAARELRRRRPGRGDRRPQAPDQHLARRRAAARAEAVGQRRRARAAVAERRHPRRPHGPGRAVGDAAHARPHRDHRRLRRRRAARGRRATRCACATSPASRTAWPSRARRPASTATPTVLLQIRKQSGTNTVEVANNVKQRLAELRGDPAAPATSCASSATRRSSSRRRSPACRSTWSSARSWPRIVVLLFLGNFRSTVIAAIAIPTSIVATFALIWYMGFTLNMLTMLALTLSVGIVIDDAIVVLENIYRFIEEKGMPPMQAAVEATQGDRPGGDGDDALAGRHLRAGRLHERHGRPLHAELRPDDGVRRAGVAVRQLHADADDVGALAEAAAEGRAPRLEAQPAVRAARSRLHAAARMGDGAPRPGRGRRRAGAAVERAAVPRSPRSTSRPRTISRSSTSRCARPRAPAWRRWRCWPTGSSTAVRQIPEVDFTLVTVAGDAAGTLNTATHAGAPASDRGRAARSVRGDGARSATRSCRPTRRRACAPRCSSGGGPGGGGGGIQFMVQGPDLEAAREVQRGAAREGAAPFPAWSTSTPR